MSTFDELGTFDTPILDEQQGDGLPRIWWHHGDQKAKPPRGGDFYTRADDLPDGLPAPWEEAQRFDDEVGFTAATLRILPITYRMQAFVKDEDGRRTYLPQWVKGASLHTELLCFAEGFDGPVVWSMKGTTGKAVTDPKGSIFATAKKLIILEAERRLKKRVPMYAFWLPITTLQENGRTKFVRLEQGSIVTPPMLDLPPHKTTEDLLNDLYAGKGLIEHAAELRAEYDAWRQERRAIQAPAPAPDEGEADLPPVSRNQPRPIEADEDIPF
jgi:hypothetical protein